jgi:hypothetical protein
VLGLVIVAEGSVQVADPTGELGSPSARWVDAFPWIEVAAFWHSPTVEGATAEDRELLAGEWWSTPIDTFGPGQRGRVFALVAELALERLTRWPIEIIFPHLGRDVPLAGLMVSTRARSMFMRQGYVVTGDLLGLDLRDLLDTPNVGVGTVDSILQVLAAVSITTTGSPDTSATATPAGTDAGRSDDRGAGRPWREEMVKDMTLLAEWNAALGAAGHALLGEEPPPGTPAPILQARQRLNSISSADVLGPAAHHLDAAQLVKSALDALDERAQLVLTRRMFADKPQTLDDLGRELHVTRERVRQIESKARSAIVELLGQGGVLEHVATTLRNVISPVLALDDLEALLPVVAKIVEGVGQPVWRILDRLDDSYEIEDGWCAAPSIAGARDAMQTRLQELADRHGVVRLDDVEPVGMYQPEPQSGQVLRRWLTYCGYTLIGEHALTKTRSVADCAAALLSIRSTPLGSQEILELLHQDRSLGTLKNAMAGDERFERVDRDRWALAEWGLEAYVGIRALVREEIGRSGGQIGQEELVERITGRYNVSASSVIAYASAAPFESKGGIVRMLSADKDVRKTPERTRRLFRRPTQWAYRLSVTKEHLRGSGCPAPVAIARILNLHPGGSRQLPSVLGPQSVGWPGTQPTFGTIRRFLLDQDAEVGSEVMLTLDDDGSFGVEPVVTLGLDPLAHALVLAGITAPDRCERPRAALARAIGLPADSQTPIVIGGYRDRGDDDIADLLITVREQLEDGVSPSPVPDADIDEIMRLL